VRLASAFGLAGAGLALTALAACSTTQQQAARLQLNSARLRAAELGVRVTRGDPRVRLLHVAVVRGRAGAAVIVTLHNSADSATSDLPISVGVRDVHRRRRYLNAAPGIDYFQTHVPAIPAGATLSWVFTTRRRLPPAAHPFAEVGLPALAAVPARAALPRVTVAAIAQTGRELQLTIDNESAVPQYQLQVYAVALRAGRYVAAGTASIPHLGAGSRLALRIALLGGGGAARIAVQAPPTIFG
jgi:hypothetical protein